MLLHAIIFVSGGAILALELLASRVMTPYFGVSLYIWTGILSITLVALALGYAAGGRLAAHLSAGDRAVARLTRSFALMPAIAAFGIVAACLAYPFLFSPFAKWGLVGGAFLAAIVLLFVPLVAASAMNPLLVAIFVERGKKNVAADAGAGHVFFVSTLGSVVGVVATAFVLIPYLTNFAALLVVAIVLAVLSLAAAIFTPRQVTGRVTVGLIAGVAGLIAGALLAGADSYTGRQGPHAHGGVRWRVEAVQSSLFGTVKVLRTEAPAGSRFLRTYFHDGLTQNTVDSDNRSVSFYTYALEALGRAYQPQMHGALVLGLGAGMVPMRLAELGVPVEVVDIDPVAPRIARQYFGFRPDKAVVHQADARTFVERCSGNYDLAIVDLFQGDGTPDYLVTREFFAALRSCLAKGGVAVFNTFADVTKPERYAHFLVTLRTELPHFVMYRPKSPSVHVNSFIVASAEPLRPPARVTFDYLPDQHQQAMWDMLSAPTPLTPTHFTGGQIVTDARNPAAHDFAQTQIAYRKSVVETTPPAMLLN